MEYPKQLRQFNCDDQRHDEAKYPWAVNVRWLSKVLMVVDHSFDMRKCRVSAQLDEQRIVSVWHPVHDVGMHTVSGEPFEQRTQLVGIRDDVTQIVQRHPPSPEPFDQVCSHLTSTTCDAMARSATTPAGVGPIDASVLRGSVWLSRPMVSARRVGPRVSAMSPRERLVER